MIAALWSLKLSLKIKVKIKPIIMKTKMKKPQYHLHLEKRQGLLTFFTGNVRMALNRKFTIRIIRVLTRANTIPRAQFSLIALKKRTCNKMTRSKSIAKLDKIFLFFE